MHENTLTPLANIMLDAYAAGTTYTRRFIDEQGYPPTAVSKAHHVLSVVQAEIVASDRYSLGGAYAESGRVEIEDREDGDTYLLRSQRAIAINKVFPRYQAPTLPGLEVTRVISPILLLIHKFHSTGLDLLVASTQQVPDTHRIMPLGEPAPVGTWLYSASGSFSSGSEDPFGDVGDVGDLGEEGDEHG